MVVLEILHFNYILFPVSIQQRFMKSLLKNLKKERKKKLMFFARHLGDPYVKRPLWSYQGGGRGESKQEKHLAKTPEYDRGLARTRDPDLKFRGAEFEWGHRCRTQAGWVWVLTPPLASLSESLKQPGIYVKWGHKSKQPTTRMKLSSIMLSERSQNKRLHTVWFYLCDILEKDQWTTGTVERTGLTIKGPLTYSWE